MKYLNPAYYFSATQRVQHSLSISFQELIFLGLIISTAIDTTPFFNFHLGRLQISTPDLFLGLLIYVLIANMANEKQELSRFSTKAALLLCFAGVLSLVNLMYVGGRYVMLDIKVSLKFFEHATLIFVVGSTVSNVATLKRSLQVLCFSAVFLATLIILQSLGVFHTGAGFTRMTTLQLGPFLIGTLAVSEGMMGVSLLFLSAFPFMASRFVFSSLPVRSIFISIIVLAAVITFSRSLWVSLGVETALLLLFFTNQIKSAFLKCFTIFLLVAGLVFFIININTLYSLLVELRSSTVTGRLDGYLSALSLVSSNPLYILFGAGKGQFLQIQLLAGEGAVAHNILIDILTGKGLLVLCIILFLLSVIIIKMIFTKYSNHRIINNIGLISVIGVLVEGMFSPATNSIQFWITIAISCTIISISNKNTPKLY